MTMIASAKDIVQRFNSLENSRTNWDQHWQEIADFILPRKDDVHKNQGQFTSGERKLNRVYDSTAMQANELLASALHGLLTSPSKLWFELTTGDPALDRDDEVRSWLQDTTRRIHNALNQTNFQTEIHEVYLDLGAFGTGLMLIEEDKDRLLRFEARPIYEAWIDENSKGEVDTVYRSFLWDLRKIKQEFGEDVLPEEVLRRMKSKKNNGKQFEVIHAVFPREEAAQGMGVPKRMKFASFWVLREEDVILRAKGFKEFPFVVPRWTKITSEKYGRSPGMKALPDIKMQNAIMKVTIRSAQKTVDPPLQMPDDGTVLPLRMSPGAINYRRPGSEPITPIVTGSRVDFGIQFVELLKNSIREAFFIDQLQLLQGPQMTATEVAQRTEEKLRLLGPILARQQFELLRPMIDRIFSIMLRREQFLEPPQLLVEQGELQVQYSSEVAKAQRISETNNVSRALGLIGPILQLDPDAGKVVDSAEAVRSIMKMFGLPEEMIRSDSEIRQIEEQQLAAAQAAAQQQQEAQEAENISKAGPALLQAREQGAI